MWVYGDCSAELLHFVCFVWVSLSCINEVVAIQSDCCAGFGWVKIKGGCHTYLAYETAYNAMMQSRHHWISATRAVYIADSGDGGDGEESCPGVDNWHLWQPDSWLAKVTRMISMMCGTHSQSLLGPSLKSFFFWKTFLRVKNEDKDEDDGGAGCSRFDIFGNQWPGSCCQIWMLIPPLKLFGAATM